MTEVPVIPQEPGGETAPPSQSLVERLGLNPMLFGFVSLAVIFFLYQVGGGIATFLILGGADISPAHVATIRWLTFGGQFLLIFIPTIILGRMLSVRFSSVFPFRLPMFRETILVIISLVSLQRLLEVYMYLQSQIPLPPIVEQLLTPLRKMMEELMRMLIAANSGTELMVVLFVVAVGPAVIEELMFRGLIQSSFSRALSPAWAAVVSGIVFGMYHLNPFNLVPLAGLGIYLGIVRTRSATLILPILIHFTNNALAVAANQLHIDENAIITPTGPAEPTMSVLLFQSLLFGMMFAWSMVSYYRVTEGVAESRTGPGHDDGM